MENDRLLTCNHETKMVPKSFYTDSVSDVGRSHSRLLKLLIVVFAQTQTVDVRTKAHCWKTGGHVLCFPEWRKQTPLAQVQGHSWIAHICTPCVCFSGFAALERQNRHPIQSEFATKLFKRGLPLLSFSFSSTLHFHWASQSHISVLVVDWVACV